MATIVIDAGHGGTDSGDVGPDGTKEKHINWEVAVVVCDKLRELKHKCDVAPHRAKRRTPLGERVSFARRQKADYFVSIHANAEGGSGYEVFYPLRERYTEASRQFAHRLGAFYGRSTDLKPRSPYDGVKNETQSKPRRLGVLHDHLPNTMAVLLELAFIDNPEELKLLKTDDFKDKVAESFAAAIGEIIG